MIIRIADQKIVITAEKYIFSQFKIVIKLMRAMEPIMHQSRTTLE